MAMLRLRIPRIRCTSSSRGCAHTCSVPCVRCICGLEDPWDVYRLEKHLPGSEMRLRCYEACSEACRCISTSCIRGRIAPCATELRSGCGVAFARTTSGVELHPCLDQRAHVPSVQPSQRPRANKTSSACEASARSTTQARPQLPQAQCLVPKLAQAQLQQCLVLPLPQARPCPHPHQIRPPLRS